MPQITKIEFHLETNDLSGAGTDGDVYLGICGREFSIDTTKDDFERGSGRTYVLGEDADIRNAEFNDPREQRLFTENVPNFPVYVRFQPQTRGDNWNVRRADVRFNGALHIDWDTLPSIAREGIWLGVRSGLFVHLTNVSHGPTGGQAG